jgi:hypothetical protein
VSWKQAEENENGLEAKAFEEASGRNAGATKLIKCTFGSESK